MSALPTLATDFVRALLLSDRDTGPSFIAAASGLVRIADQSFVIADDDLRLARFTDDSTKLGETQVLLPGTLPSEAKTRKTAKPDFEALIHLPAFANFSRGALLALGSGSAATRQRGVLIDLQDMRTLQVIDFAPFFADVQIRLGLPNIEGGVVWRDHLCLLHRGNQQGRNALIRMPLAQACHALCVGQSPTLTPHVSIQFIDLGQLDDIVLGWTDADVLRDHLLISAAAENTDHAFDDGACAGSVIAILDWSGAVLHRYRLNGTDKVEGIAASECTDHISVDLVTDNDDPSTPARQLRVELPLDLLR